MGSSKKITVSYWYKLIAHLGWCKGPIDALLAIRGGDREAWTGRQTTSGIINVNRPNLYGGESAEGGIDGQFEVMMGEADQMPNSYLASEFGEAQPGYRGRSTIVLRGPKIGAGNPYPKTLYFKLQRIFKGWDNDVCWYPERANIGETSSKAPVEGTWPWVNRAANYFVVGAAQEVSGSYSGFQGWWHGNIDSFRITKGVARYASSEYTVPSTAFGGSGVDPHYGNVVLLLRMLGADQSQVFVDDKGHTVTAMGGAKIVTDRSKFGGSSAYFDGEDDWLQCMMGADTDLGSGPWTMDAWVWLDSYRSSNYSRAVFGFGPVSVGANDTSWYCVGDEWRYDQLETGDQNNPSVRQNIEPRMELGRWAFVSICWDGDRYWIHQDGKLLTGVTSPFAMNPAHILYDSITSRRENGGMEEPIARINDASFRAAADKFYSEGFGLCCTWYGGESAEQFQQRICNVAGASLSQSRKDGQYYIDLLREPLDPASLPTITDDDIREWEAEPAVPPESINQMQVKWFDPETRQERITTPVQSLGAIEDAGGVIADVREYYEIPLEPLALRVAQRDLQSVASALWKFTISCTRRPYDLRPGMQVRLLCPKRGFADVVVVVGDIDYGDFSNDEISLIAVQDVFSMPSGSFVDPQEGLGPPTSQDPVNIDNAIAMETPYVELAAALTTAELEALHEDVGYLMVGARRPANGSNYLLATKAAGEEYETYGNNDWTPSARIVEGDSLPNVIPQTDFTIIQRQLLDQVVVGTWAWWGSELCRVDALDLDDGTITLGRACGDTVPQEHPPLEMIYFIGDWYGTDSREYADGEEVSAKLMNRTGQGQVDIAVAPEVSVEMDSRQARPYPPAKVRVNGDPFPTAATGEITLTWAHRDRLLQADQLIDGEQDSIGPEPGTTYNVRWFIGDMLFHSETGVTGTTASYSPAAGGMMRVELESERDGLVSWQMQVREFPVGSPLLAEDNTVITAENGDAIIMG